MTAPKEEIKVWSVAMCWVGDEPIYGNEAGFVKQMLYQAVLDARAIARRDAGYFQKLRKRKTSGGDMWVIERANKTLRAWLDCEQFEWYCDLLHWNIGRVRLAIIAIAEGKDYEELRAHLMLMGVLSRWEQRKSEPARVQTNNLCPMRSAGNHVKRVQTAMR